MIITITAHHFLGCLLAVHEPLGDDTWSEELIALTELLEEDSVGETETADPDPLQHTIATQLVQDKRGHNLTSLCSYVKECTCRYVYSTVIPIELHVHVLVINHGYTSLQLNQCERH